jgi:hypothetical protein
VLTTQHPLSAKVGTNSSTSDGRLVGIVHLRTKAREFVLLAIIGKSLEASEIHGVLYYILQERDSFPLQQDTFQRIKINNL